MAFAAAVSFFCFLRVYSGHEKRMLLLLTSDFDPFPLRILDAKREPNKDALSHRVTVTVDLNRISVCDPRFRRTWRRLAEDWSF